MMAMLKIHNSQKLKDIGWKLLLQVRACIILACFRASIQLPTHDHRCVASTLHRSFRSPAEFIVM